MKNNKLILTILGVLLAAIVIVGSTFAVWSWRSDRSNDTNVTFTTEKGFSCSVDGGGNITEADIKLVPTSCDNSEYVIKRTITTNVVNNKNLPIYMDLWLDIKKLSQGLSDSHNFRYTITTSSTSCSDGNIISYGTFNTKEVNDKIDLILNDKYASTGTKTYYLYIWLDYNGIDRTSQEEEFTLELGGECTDSSNSDRVYKANKPYVYNTGLIPVVLSDSGDTVTTIEEDNPNWYNYDQKKWANAILVKENGTKKRSYYKGFPGTIVNQDDILAYYVWIPRYSYKVWQLSGAPNNTQDDTHHSIDIKFIPTTVIDELPTEIDKYYTHPAFWWDNDSDGIREEGEELSGIWVSKFEISHQTLSIETLSTTDNSLGKDSGTAICNSTECNNYTGLRILPNVRALRYNRISNFFYASKLMESDGNPFGLNGNNVDSHITKNSEWGAITYLSHSKYGINGNVWINRTKTTGCGAEDSSVDTTSSTCVDTYGTMTTYQQSTTGNVTGVFDMSGGSSEYVMGVYNNTIASSGFVQLPDAKYYNNYSNPPFTNSTYMDVFNCTLEYCGGHALNETYHWYFTTVISFVNNPNPWFQRGTNMNGGGLGFFVIAYRTGTSTNWISSRLVLVTK